MSMPTSAIAATATGLIWSAGCGAGRAARRPGRRRGAGGSRRPSATGRRCGRRRTGRSGVGHRALLGGRRVEQRATSAEPERAADQLHQDERRHRGRGDAGEGVGQHAGDRHRRVGEAGRAREPVGRRDVAADRERDGVDPRRSQAAEDDQHQPERWRRPRPSRCRRRRARVVRERSPRRGRTSGSRRRRRRRPPSTCAATSGRPRGCVIRPRARSTKVTTGLKDADTGCRARISATSAAPVARLFSSSCRPTSSGDSRWAAMPEPTTASDEERRTDELGAAARTGEVHRRRRRAAPPGRRGGPGSTR